MLLRSLHAQLERIAATLRVRREFIETRLTGDPFLTFFHRWRSQIGVSGPGRCAGLPRHTTLWYYHIVEFIESSAFTRRLRQLAGGAAGELLNAIQRDLLEKPDRGVMVPGLGGVRKARLANPLRGKGKRGGYRYLYLYFEGRQHIHLLILLDKNEQEDASKEQRRQMRDWVARIKRDTGE
jgi:hypothetical protein